jgi:hypothetical protein
MTRATALGPRALACWTEFMTERSEQDCEVWVPYASYQDIARFEYGRRMWRRPNMRARLLAHWTDARHPYHERFAEQREVIESVLESDEPPAVLDRELRKRGFSLRAISREIPPVFGAFFAAARQGSLE